MKPKHEAFLWIAGILVFSTVGSHLARMWRGRSVPSFADYVDFAGITFIMLSITIVTGMWRSRPNDPNNLVGNAMRMILMFVSRVTFFLIIPVALLVPWLRDWLFLGQRAMIYGVIALVSTAGFVIASRLAASRKYAEIAAAAAAKANGG
jgi:hypothetical protein